MNDSTPPHLTWSSLPALFPHFSEPDRWLKLLQTHARIVETWRGRLNLTAVGPEEAVRRNYAESLEIWDIATRSTVPRTGVDVGPGAGFPGLIAAAVSPSCSFHLVEPLKRRAEFLSIARAEMGLANVAVHPSRAEDLGRSTLRDSVDVVLARAVAPLRELLEYAGPFAAVGGILALPKGSSLEAEVDTAQHAADTLGLALRGVMAMRPAISTTLSVVVYEKVAPTPDRYPRRAGVPAQRPI